jgi:hypothetical protein
MDSTSFVYFIKPVGMDGPIKIGCSWSPESRLRALMVWSPFDLEIVATIAGDFDLEGRIHAQFAEHHRRQEWFNWTPELLALIEEVKAGRPIGDFIDGTANTSIRRGYQRPSEQRRYMGYRTRLSFAFKRVQDQSRDRSVWYRPPSDVEDIMDRWGANGFSTGRAVSPSDQEIARLEEVLADPQRHATADQW